MRASLRFCCVLFRGFARSSRDGTVGSIEPDQVSTIAPQAPSTARRGQGRPVKTGSRWPDRTGAAFRLGLHAASDFARFNPPPNPIDDSPAIGPVGIGWASLRLMKP